MARIRAFIAITVPVEIKKRLREVQDEIRSRGCIEAEGEQKKSAVSFVRAANIHLTLAFLGKIPETSLNALSNAIQAAVAGIKPFDLTVGRVELKSRRLLWAPVSSDGDKLAGLVEALDEELTPLGYERERRRFRGHLTLARIKTGGTAEKLGKFLKENDFTINATFTASGVTLFKSELTPDGAIYTLLREFLLYKNPDDE